MCLEGITICLVILFLWYNGNKEGIMELPKIEISDKEMKKNLKRFVEEIGKEDGEELIVGNKEIKELRKRIEKEIEKDLWLMVMEGRSEKSKN